MSQSDWQASPPPRQSPPPPPAPPAAQVPANWGTAGVPMVIVAPPSHDAGSPARGAAGWYVLIIMTIAAIVAVWFAVLTFNPLNGSPAKYPPGVLKKLERQEAEIQQRDVLQAYRNQLIMQTQQMDTTKSFPEAPQAPPLARDIADNTATIERLRAENIKYCQRDLKNCATQVKTFVCNFEKSQGVGGWCAGAPDYRNECTLTAPSADCKALRQRYCLVSEAFCVAQDNVASATSLTGN